MKLMEQSGPRPADVIREYGNCLELVPTDKHFGDISVGLYVKDAICTVWTYSRKPGVDGRMREIRDQMAALGGMEPVEGTDNQLKFPCGHLHNRPLRFLMAQAVGKSPDYAPPEGPMTIKDSKSALTIRVDTPSEDAAPYRVSLEGDGGNTALRLRMVLAGFVRYGEMDQAGDSGVSFNCGSRHDALMRILLPYSRNISSVETMMAAEAMRGQMTTGTMGFSQT